MVLRNAAGTAVAQERVVPGTCNANGLYQGELQDSLTDGSCAFLDIYTAEGGSLFATIVECTTGAWQPFSVNAGDQDVFFVLRTNSLSVGRRNFGF
jgi:hypothetical protein